MEVYKFCADMGFVRKWITSLALSSTIKCVIPSEKISWRPSITAQNLAKTLVTQPIDMK